MSDPEIIAQRLAARLATDAEDIALATLAHERRRQIEQEGTLTFDELCASAGIDPADIDDDK